MVRISVDANDDGGEVNAALAVIDFNFVVDVVFLIGGAFDGVEHGGFFVVASNK